MSEGTLLAAVPCITAPKSARGHLSETFVKKLSTMLFFYSNLRQRDRWELKFSAQARQQRCLCSELSFSLVTLQRLDAASSGH